MEVFYGTAREITAWMQLVRLLRAEFPGLETEAALEEHRQTVLRFMEKGHAIGVREGEALAGVMLISTRLNMLCCLGVHPDFRRKGVASLLMAEALKRLDNQREITVTTYRREDPKGPAARGLYEKFGFVPCELVEEMGYPNQVFTKFPVGSEAEGRWRAIGRMTEAIGEILEGCRPSIYLYGSCVLEDFRRGWSDIDILVLTGKPMGQAQAEHLVNLRQTLLAAEPENPYYRSFEGGMLTREAFVKNAADRVVYWGTSGQRITDRYAFDGFCRGELLEKGKLLLGPEVRGGMALPTREELKRDVTRYYELIRQYAQQTGRSFYSYGWLLDIARGIYTLRTGLVAAKTAAGDWALAQGLCPVPEELVAALEVRQNPEKYRDDPATFDRAETLGPAVQQFADVLQKELQK